MNITFRELSTKFTNLKRRMKFKITKRDAFVCIVFIIFFFIGYIYQLAFSIFECMKYDGTVIKNVKMNIDNRSVVVMLRFENYVSPISVTVGDICMDVSLFNERLCTLNGSSFTLKKNEEICIQDTLLITLNDKYDFTKLRKIKNLRNIQIHFCLKLSKSFFGLSVSLPVNYTYNHQLENGDSSLINLYNYVIDPDQRFVTLRLALYHTYLFFEFSRFNFNVNFNGKEIATVECFQFGEMGCDIKIIFTKKHTAGFVEAFRLKYKEKKVQLTFSKFDFPETFDRSIKEIISNLIKSNEINNEKNLKNMEITDQVPFFDYKMFGIIKDKLIGEFSVHSSFIDNYLPSKFFINKIKMLSILNCCMYSITDKIKKIGYLRMDIKDRVDYLCFDFEFEVVDLGALLGDCIQRPENAFLKISCVNKDFIGEMLKGFHFLWDFNSNFDFTYATKLKKTPEIIKEIQKLDINEFSITSNIYTNKKRMDMNNETDTTDDIESDTKDAETNTDTDEIYEPVKTSIGFDIMTKLTLPKTKKKGPYMSISWSQFFFSIKMEGLRLRLKVSMGCIHLATNYNHISDIFRSDKTISTFLKVRKSNSNIKNCIFLRNSSSHLYLNTNIFFRILHNIGQVGIQGELKYPFKFNRKENKPTASRMLSHLKFRFGNLISFSHLRLNLKSEPMSKTEEFYVIMCEIKLPDLELRVKEKEFVNDFLRLSTPESKISFNYSNGIIHHLIIETEEEDMIPLDIVIIWKNMCKNLPKFKNLIFSSNNYLVYTIIDLVSDLNIRLPKINDVQFENRDLLKNLKIVDDPIKIYNHMNYKNGILKGEIKLYLPISTYVMNMVNSNSLSASWDHFSLRLVDKKEKNIVLNFGPGKISMKIEGDNKIIQDQGLFYIEYNIDTGFEYNALEYITIEGIGKNKSIEFDQDIKKYINDLLNMESDINIDHYSGIQMVEKSRCVKKGNNVINFESDFSISYNYREIVENLGKKLGYLVLHLSLMGYPRSINLECLITNNYLTFLIPNKEIRLSVNIEANCMVLYGNEYDSNFKNKEDIVISTKINLECLENTCKEEKIIEDIKQPFGIMSFFDQIPAYINLFYYINSNLEIKTNQFQQVEILFTLPLSMDFSKTAGSFLFYKDNILIASIDLSLIKPEICKNDYNTSPKKIYKKSKVTIVIHNSSFKCDNEIHVFYKDETGLSLEVFCIDLQPISGVLTFFINIIGIKNLMVFLENFYGDNSLKNKLGNTSNILSEMYKRAKKFCVLW